jgi:GTP cyclohydrolase I
MLRHIAGMAAGHAVITEITFRVVYSVYPVIQVRAIRVFGVGQHHLLRFDSAVITPT